MIRLGQIVTVGEVTQGQTGLDLENRTYHKLEIYFGLHLRRDCTFQNRQFFGCECSVTESEGGLYNACNLRLAENAMGKLFCWQRGLPSPLLAAADSLAKEG